MNPHAHSEASKAFHPSRGLEFYLYFWSLILDPLLFFVISDQDVTGVNLTLGRVVQICFLTTLVLRLALKQTALSIPNPSFSLFRNYSIYVLLVVASSVFGLLALDAYEVDYVHTVEYGSWFAETIRGAYTRPLLELIIFLYYFFYYVVLPKYYFRTPQELQYLFKWLSRTLVLMLFIGLLDVISNALGGPYIPKHSVHTEFGYVGERFHALLGEPRDAFPYLLFALAVVYLRCSVDDQTKVPRLLVPLVLVSLVLTQSGSGLIGIVIGAVGMVTYLSVKSLKMLFRALLGAIFVFSLILLIVNSTPRLMDYIEAFSNVWATLNSGGDLPYLVAVQSSNFLPLWDMWVNLNNFEWFQVLFGSGLGTTSIINNNLSNVFILDSSAQLMNSHAQITRVLYESGILGLLLYVSIFVVPVKRFLDRFPANKTANFILFASLLGASLSHRSTAIFIYLGIVIALLTNWGECKAEGQCGKAV